MHVSKTILKIKFSYVSYVNILRKSLRKKIRTCECSYMCESNVGDMNNAKEFLNIPNTFLAMAIAPLR